MPSDAERVEAITEAILANDDHARFEMLMSNGQVITGVFHFTKPITIERNITVNGATFHFPKGMDLPWITIRPALNITISNSLFMDTKS